MIVCERVFVGVNNQCIVFVIGYLEREIKKDSIPMMDTGENPEAPQPREMYDLEVCLLL
jgi:hypothetical protein